MAFTHGIYNTERETSIVAPITTTAGIPIIVGSAPIHLVAGNPKEVTNRPVLLNNYAEAVNTLGYSDDWGAYTLCEAIDFYFRVQGVGPIICINVYDGGYTNQEVEEFVETTVGEAADADSIWIADENGNKLEQDTDYTLTWSETGFVVTPEEARTGEKVTIYYRLSDAETPIITKEDIIGGVDSDGTETGIEAIRKVYPILGIVPGILLAPGFSHIAEVSAALKAKTYSLNGCYNVHSIVDIDSSSSGAKTYTAVKLQKEGQGLTDPEQYAVWPMAKVGEKMYHGSIAAAALADYVDAQNDGVPYCSPSNHALSITGICLADGKEVVIDQEQANIVNSFGVATFLNRNGWRLWGNQTCAYPGITDIKDAMLPVRRMFNWLENNFVETFFQKVDNPANYRLIESIVDSFNQTGNYYVNQGYCARCEIMFDIEENPATEILNGTIKFHTYFSPYPAAQTIKNTLEFDPTALQTALSGE